MAAHSSVLAWRIPGTGEPGGLPSVGSQRVGHDWSGFSHNVIIFTFTHVGMLLSPLRTQPLFLSTCQKPIILQNSLLAKRLPWKRSGLWPASWHQPSHHVLASAAPVSQIFTVYFHTLLYLFCLSVSLQTLSSWAQGPVRYHCISFLCPQGLLHCQAHSQYKHRCTFILPLAPYLLLRADNHCLKIRPLVHQGL